MRGGLFALKGWRFGLLSNFPEIPDVYDLFFFREWQVPIDGMRSAENNDVCIVHSLLKFDEGRILHVWVRAKNFFCLHFQELLQLVRQTVSNIVAISLKRHPQDFDSLFLEVFIW